MDRIDLKFNEWFNTDVLAENVCTIINHVTLATPTALTVNSTEGQCIAKPTKFIHICSKKSINIHEFDEIIDDIYC